MSETFPPAARREIVTLIGANGAGKTTLIMTICGNPRTRDGRIEFAGDDITHLPTYAIMRRGLGLSAGRPRHLPAHDGPREPPNGCGDGPHAQL